MTISVAEIYMLAFRKSKVPIIGEAVPHPFDFQIELDSWSWTLLPPESDDERQKREKENAEKAKARAQAKAQANAQAKDKKPGPDMAGLKKKDDDLLKLVSTMQKDQRRSQGERDRAVLEKIRLAQIERRKDVGDAGSTDDSDDEDTKPPDRFTFTFEKGVDFATAQMLSAMSVGEVLPRIVLTVRHWAENAPLTFIVTYKNVTLMNYSLNVDPGETMTDIRESWTAKFEMMDYAYQSRPGTGGIPGLTAGTARVFKMNLLKPSKWL